MSEREDQYVVEYLFAGEWLCARPAPFNSREVFYTCGRRRQRIFDRKVEAKNFEEALKEEAKELWPRKKIKTRIRTVTKKVQP